MTSRLPAPSTTTSTRCLPRPLPGIVLTNRSARSRHPRAGADQVDRLGCLRGISALAGLALTVEIGDWTRFTGALTGAYVGLVPTEYSSGASRVQGSITKAGNVHVRPLLIESAWHHRAAYRNPGPTMRARWAKVDPALKDRGHAGNRRLHQQWCRFDERKKPHVVANVAVARQLAGWCWSLATMT